MEARLADASVQLREARLLSPRTANFQQRFEVGADETRLAACISLYLPVSPCISPMQTLDKWVAACKPA